MCGSGSSCWCISGVILGVSGSCGIGVSSGMFLCVVWGVSGICGVDVSSGMFLGAVWGVSGSCCVGVASVIVCPLDNVCAVSCWECVVWYKSDGGSGVSSGLLVVKVILGLSLGCSS